MRPMASTPVASMQNIAAPDSASELMWVKCQSVAEPSTAEYWHIRARGMKPLHDVARRLGRYEHAEPDGAVGILQADLGRRRHVRQVGDALVGGDHQRLHLPFLDQRQRGRKRTEIEIDPAAQDIG